MHTWMNVHECYFEIENDLGEVKAQHRVLDRWLCTPCGQWVKNNSDSISVHSCVLADSLQYKLWINAKFKHENATAFILNWR